MTETREQRRRRLRQACTRCGRPCLRSEAMPQDGTHWPRRVFIHAEVVLPYLVGYGHDARVATEVCV